MGPDSGLSAALIQMRRAGIRQSMMHAVPFFNHEIIVMLRSTSDTILPGEGAMLGRS
jgi:hypothetical protein